jgi:hypothetical protein
MLSSVYSWPILVTLFYLDFLDRSQSNLGPSFLPLCLTPSKALLILCVMVLTEADVVSSLVLRGQSQGQNAHSPVQGGIDLLVFSTQHGCVDQVPRP